MYYQLSLLFGLSNGDFFHSAMISFVTWKWQTPGNRAFSSAHVNVLYAMVARHYPAPFRFICITDDPAGLDERIEWISMPVRFDSLISPQGARFPNCYCRLWVFSREAAVLGERILCLDIDCVILDDLRPLVDRDEDFVGWCDDPHFADGKIAGGIYLLKTGSMPHIWEDFDPKTSPMEAFGRGNQGSDQGWMSYKLYPLLRQSSGQAGKYTIGDGIVKINWTPIGAPSPPKGARLVLANGLKPPWNADIQRLHPWVKEYWRI